MDDQDKSQQQLIDELADLRQRVTTIGMVEDITERKQAEEALQKAHDELEAKVEERTAELSKANEELLLFRKFAEASGQGFGISNLDGQIVYANPTLCRLLGEAGPEDVIGKNSLTYYPHESHKRRKDEIIPTLERTGHWAGERAILSRHGQLIPTWHDVFLLRDEKGDPVCRCVVVTDITERKRAEEALQASEERFRVTFEEAPVGMAIGVDDGVIIKANRALCRMSGYAEEELAGLHVRDCTHPDDRELSAPFLKKLLAGEIPSFTLEKRYLKKDGHPFWAQATTAAIHGPDGKIAFALGVVEDITERKQGEVALRQSHDELRAIYDNLGDGLLVADRETLRLIRANAAICSMLGYSEEELLSMSVPDVHPKEALPGILEAMQTGIDGHLPAKNNVPMLRKNGSVFYADITGDTFNYQGKPCSLGLFRDATERRRTQEALAKQHGTLKHLLQSSDRERQMIAYEIHDGLAQHLAGAIMQFEAFRHQKDKHPKQAAKAFDAGLTMLRQGHSETRRLIAGVRPPILDESGVVEAIAHLVHEQSREKRPKIEYTSRVDFDRLVPILENGIFRICQEALTNACQHSKSDRVRVSLLQQKDRVRIEVRDWGVGFDTNTTPKNRYGLEGIRQRAKLLGGKCSLRSKPGQGTRVVVELPVVAREEE